MSSMIEDIKSSLKPDWTHRRLVIRLALVLGAMILISLFASSVWLALIGKFGFYISTFFITFLICNFIAILGIIGSYVFSAQWENKDFLNILPQIIPHMSKPEIPEIPELPKEGDKEEE